MQENERHNLDGADRELEAALRGLKPAIRGTPLDPVACAFNAGRRAARQQTNPWRMTSAILAIALALAVLYPGVSPPSVKSTAVVASRESAATLSSAASPQGLSALSVIRLRDIALERGLDAMPHTQDSSRRPLGVRDASRL